MRKALPCTGDIDTVTACEGAVSREVEKIKNITSGLLTNILPASYCHPPHLAIVHLAKQSEFVKSIDGHPTSGITLPIRAQRVEEERENNLNYMSIT